MNRGKAERAVEESDLPMAETLTMMMLLRRAHNDTLAVPDWRTPSLPQLAAAVRVSTSTIRRLLAHLERHGWVKRIPGDGRGHKSTYALLPAGAAPGPCSCRKKTNPSSPFPGRKGVTRTTPFSGTKGVREHPERVSNTPATPQVSNGFAPRAHQGGEVTRVAQACIGGCGRPARNGCLTCWDHARLEAAR